MREDHDDMVLTDEERGAVLRLADERGDASAARLLGLQPATLLRIIARRPTRRGTTLLVRAALASLSTEGERATG